MSLINQMLQDLEERSSGFAEQDLRRMVSGDLRAAPGRHSSRWRIMWPLFAMGTLAVVLAMYFRVGLPEFRFGSASPAGLPLTQPVASDPLTATQASSPQTAAGELLQSAPEPDPATVPESDRAANQVEEPPLSPAPAVAVVEKRAHVPSPAEQAELYYLDATSLLKRGKLDEAEALLWQALYTSPWHVEARELLVGIKLRQGDPERAQALLRRGMERVPSHTGFVLMLARMEVEAGHEAAALQVLEQHRDRAVDDPDYRALAANLYQRAGRHRDAAEEFRGALARRPAESRWWVGLAISLEASEQWAVARDAYLRARSVGRLEPTLEQYVAGRLAALDSRVAAKP